MDTEADPGSPAGEAPGVLAALDAAATPDETPALTPSTADAPVLPGPSPVASPAVLHHPVVEVERAHPTPPPPRPRASIAFLVTVTALSLAADLASKAWAKGHLAGGEGRAHSVRKLDVWKGHVDFIFAQNPGGAWSFLRSLPDSLRRPFFLVVSAAAIVFIVSIYQRVYRDQTTMKWGLPLALGGAMGNLADRIRYGWVVDFVDVYVTRRGHEHHWPTFNVADIAIVVGVVLMAIDMMRARGRVPEDRAPASTTPTPAV
jgi:signal peptidase II